LSITPNQGTIVNYRKKISMCGRVTDSPKANFKDTLVKNTFKIYDKILIFLIYEVLIT
jgi:hypothetical protein